MLSRSVFSNPTVSILMPVWRPDAGFLRIAVESVLAQTLEDFELVIVEDPSEVSAKPTLDQFDDPRVRLHINAHRTNIVDQLNVGLALCQADLVARFDADDICAPERLQEQVDFLRLNRDVSILGTQLRVIDAQGRQLGFRRYPTTHAKIVRALAQFNPIAHPSVMFRKDVVVGAGGYRGIEGPNGNVPWCQDYELWSRLAGSAVVFSNHEEPLVSYRIHGQQVKSANVHDVLRVVLRIKQRYWRQRMTWLDWSRMNVERLLLLLPAGLVVSLFRVLQVRSRRGRK